MIRTLTVIALIGAPATAIAMSAKEKSETMIEARSSAKATLKNAAGEEVGEATATDIGHGLRVTIEVDDQQPGERAWHLHAIGKCDDAKFTSAGPHWNPANKMHGKDNPMGLHAGDLPNLMVAADGEASASFEIHGAKLTGDGGLLDMDGGAVVVHALPDDYKTDPAGAAGDRIACGVFVADAD